MISVIVPLYNAAPFIENCVNGILNNAYQDHELLLINDGSEDKILEATNELAKKTNVFE